MWSEAGTGTEGRERLQKEAATPGGQVAGVTSKEINTRGISEGRPTRKDPSTRPPNLNPLHRCLNGTVTCTVQMISTPHHCLKVVSLQQPLMGCTLQGQGRGLISDAVSDQPAVMSSQWPPPTHLLSSTQHSWVVPSLGQRNWTNILLKFPFPAYNHCSGASQWPSFQDLAALN